MKTKVCSKCKIEKDISEFDKQSGVRYKDNIRPWCRECYRLYARERYNKKRKECIEATRNYQRRNLEHVRSKKSERKSTHAKYDTYAHKIDFCEEVRRDPSNSDLLQVKCTESSCRKWFNPTIISIENRIYRINNLVWGEARLYCSEECKQRCVLFGQISYTKDNKPDYIREVQPELRELVFRRDNYECQRCGSKKKLQCHHFEGVNVNPIMSADTDMCITLCKDCHKKAHTDDGCRYIDLKCKE